MLIVPRPAERPRFSKFGGAYNSKAYSSYKQSLVEALKAKIFEGQIRLPADYAGVSADFYLPVPKSWTKKKKAAHYGMLHRSKPDADNYLKAICDAMTEAKVFTDDGQVAQMVARKWYVLEGEYPRLGFTLHTLDDIINQDL
nr:RusA family crossover junction endodeoxyribonuclease [Hymenobacter siberiensis]